MKSINSYISILQVFVLVCGSMILFTSCDEPYELDLHEHADRIVIEGHLTNASGYQYVKISRTTGFYQEGKTPRITNAFVKVVDDLNQEFLFEHNPTESLDSIGYYLPVHDFKGEIGRTYTLHVDIEGETYKATDKLFSVTSIDSLSYKIDEREKKDPRKENKFYRVSAYVREPADEDNFYLFKFFRNDSIQYLYHTDIYFTDDKLLQEEINGWETPIYYGEGDTFQMKIFSLTRAGYVYFNDLSKLLTEDAGGMFGSIPAPPRTNLTNGAIGFFQVSAVDSISIKIE